MKKNKNLKYIISAITVMCVALFPIITMTSCSTSKDKVTDENSSILLKNALLLDKNYEYEQNDVLVVDGKIKAIGKNLGSADKEVDFEGYTLMPGFIDAHVHVATSNTEFSDESIKAWLNNGVTTIGDLGMLSTLGADEYSQWIKEENKKTDVAKIVSAGKYIDVEGGYGAGPMPDAVVGTMIKTADEAAAAVTKTHDEGFSIIKIGLSDSGPRMTGEMITAICERADSLGMTLVAHISTSAQVEELLNYGVRNFGHTPSDKMSDELIDRMVELGVVMHSTVGEPKDNSNTIKLDNLKRFHEAGGTIVSSTDLIHSSDWEADAKIPVTELRQLYDQGLSLQEVINTATINAANFLGKGDTEGTIEVGKEANLVAVKGKLDDKFEALKDVDFVMHYGTIIKNNSSDVSTK